MYQRLPFHYGFAVIAVTFTALLAAAGLRAAPGVLILPLELAFGWDRATVSTGAGLGILANGLVGPFAGAFMQRYGIKRVLLAGLALMALATSTSLFMTKPWHYLLTWGLFSGIGSGAVAGVLAAAIVNRWFSKRQGLMMGVLTASTATGSLIFLPLFARLSQSGDWRPVVSLVSISMGTLIPITWLLLPENPRDLGLRRYGDFADPEPQEPAMLSRSFAALHVVKSASGIPTFWLLCGAFFVCGFTTNGVIGTHLIAFCGDHGIPPVQAAKWLAFMGIFDLMGATASGWLSDRYNPLYLLVGYFAVRGLALLAMPFVGLSTVSLTIFAIFFGLDWIATVPPTLKLVNKHFGQATGQIVYGWIFTAHQAGAATAAVGAGLISEIAGSYAPAFLLAGMLALLVSFVFLLWTRRFSSLGIVAV